MAEKKKLLRRAIHDKQNPYMQLKRTTAQDKKISYEALGMLVYVLSQRDDWCIQPNELVTEKCGRDKVYRILKELMKNKYVEHEKSFDAQHKIVWGDYIVHEYPVTSNPYTENQEVDLGEKPFTENPDTENKDSNDYSNTKETKETKSADAPPPHKFPRSINSYTADDVLTYQSQHTAEMKALVQAWDGTMYNSITEFSTKVGRMYIETHMELSRLNKPCAEYLAIANHTKKKDAWKDGHKVTDMLLHLTDFKPVAPKVYDDPTMDLNIKQPIVPILMQEAAKHHG